MVDENQSWDAYRAGDTRAFEAIYSAYFKRLFHYGTRLTSNRDQVEQAIQDLFTKLWSKRLRIGQTSSVGNYLFVSFRRILLASLKKESAQRSAQIGFYQQEFSIELSAEFILIDRERIEELQKKISQALSGMTPRQREIIYLKYYQDLSYEDIALVMDINTKATYKLLYRALDQLRKILGDPALLLLALTLLRLRQDAPTAV